MKQELVIALAGNPNAGKSTVFNALTGARQHVGNWPGKTVEKKEGTWKYNGNSCKIVDLPGTYSLTAFSLEEIIARDFLIEEQPNIVVAVVDSANLERNLYLVTQILELGAPVVVALNMSDIAETRGIKIDVEMLSAGLGVPVVATAASKNIGLKQLQEVLSRSAEIASSKPGKLVNYGSEVEKEISAIVEILGSQSELSQKYSPRWLAIKLLEEDEEVIKRLQADTQYQALLDRAEQSIAYLQNMYGEDCDTLLADRRYGWIHGLMKETVQSSTEARINLSDRIDRVVTNRLLGIPIFLLLMWGVFKLTTDVAGPYLDWVDGVIGGPITNWISALLGMLNLTGSWVESMVIDGIVAGVGGVMVFVPVMMSLYFALAILEDSGYMARAAFVMDRLMHALGLHGKSFMPMIVGFGCTVPAFYATRTLENEKDRILTGLLLPFMSCGARLPVYVLFAAVFFPQNSGAVIFWMYLTGIIVAILVGMILKRTLFKDSQESPFVMELPPYRMPTLRAIWFHMWERTSAFLKKAWGIIMVTSVVIWFLLATPIRGEGSFANTDVTDSAFARFSEVIAPVFRPAGFDSWQATGALVTGFVAKEVVVGTMAQVYQIEGEAEEAAESSTFLQDVGGIITSFYEATRDTIKSIPLIVGINLFDDAEEEEDLTDLMVAVKEDFERGSNGHGKLAGLAYLLFVLLYTPCMVAIAAERQELGTKWMWFSIFGQLALAWLIAVLAFQGGVLLGLG